MWKVKVKYRTGEGLFFFFFFLNTLIILNKNFTIGVEWCLYPKFDFINFVKEFLKNLEPYLNFWFH